MSDLTPPDEPLDDATRARLRARVVAGLDAPTRGNRPWLVPVAASVAVGALVVGIVALGRGDDGREAAPAGPGTPSDTASSSAPTTPAEPSSSLFVDPPVETSTAPSGLPDTACDVEAPAVLRGATMAVLNQDDERGILAFYVAGDRFVLCSDDGDVVTVLHPQPLAGGGGDRNPYEISSDFTEDGARFVAGGPVPDGDLEFQVTYTFPDGATERSVVLDSPDGDVWWVMVHESEDVEGATAAPPTVEVDGSPVPVPLEVTDTCAQANHGC